MAPRHCRARGRGGDRYDERANGSGAHRIHGVARRVQRGARGRFRVPDERRQGAGPWRGLHGAGRRSLRAVVQPGRAGEAPRDPHAPQPEHDLGPRVLPTRPRPPLGARVRRSELRPVPARRPRRERRRLRPLPDRVEPEGLLPPRGQLRRGHRLRPARLDLRPGRLRPERRRRLAVPGDGPTALPVRREEHAHALPDGERGLEVPRYRRLSGRASSS